MKARIAIPLLALVGLVLGFMLWSGGDVRDARSQEAGLVDQELSDARTPADLEGADAVPPEQDEPAAREALAVEAGTKAVAPLAFPEEGEAAIDVEVVSKDTGAPVPGIQLMLSSEEAKPGVPVTFAKSVAGSLTEMPRTNDEGRAVFLAPPGHTYMLYILGDQGIETDWRELEAPPDGKRITVRFEVRTEADVVFYGKVVDGTSEEPLVGATIGLVHDGNTTARPLTTTEAGGIFRVEGFSWSPSKLRIDHAGHAWLVTQTLPGHTTASAARVIRLQRSASVVARITDALGVPAPDHELVIETDARYLVEEGAAVRWWPGSNPTWREQTDVEGVGRVADLPPHARLTVDVLEGGRLLRRLPNTIQLEPGEERELEIRLGAACTIQGVAREPDGTAAEGLELWLLVADWPHPSRYFHKYERDQVVAKATTGSAGEFRFDGASAGDWFVGPGPQNPGVAANAQLVTVAEGEYRKDVTLEIHRNLTVSGRLVDEEGADVKSGYVTADQIGLSADVTEGRFTLGPLAPGEVRLVGMTVSGASPTATRSDPVTAAAGDEEVLIRLRRGAALGGVALLPGGREPETSRVTLIPADSSRSGFWLMGGSPRPRGGFDFTGLAPGTYHLLARDDDGFAGMLRDLVVESGDVRRDLVVRMEPAARVKLVVEAGDGPRLFLRVYQNDLSIAVATGSETITLVPGEVTVDLCTFDSLAQETVVLETRTVTAIEGEEVEVAFEVEEE